MVYVLVAEAPEELKSNEMVVHKPTFIDEIKATRGRRGVDGITSITSIRDILSLLSEKYDNTLNAYHLKLQKYENLPYKTDSDFSDILLRIVKDNRLSLVEKVIESKLKTRKPSVDTVYYVSNTLDGSSAFISLGFRMKDGKSSIKNIVKKDNVV